MNPTDHSDVERLIHKSLEAFTLAVELYNRPSLKYGAESCSMLLCNAWELMLKAHMINRFGRDSIYFSDNENRTLGLSDCLAKVFTNEKDPLRRNMRALVEFRNTNTHFITDEYEIFYGPFIQASVSNYADKMMEFHNRSVGDLIPESRLTLCLRGEIIQPDHIRAKYDAQTAKALLRRENNAKNAIGSEANSKVAVRFDTNFRITKKKSEADLEVYVNKEAEDGVAILKETREVSDVYPYTAKHAIEKINGSLKRQHVEFYVNGEHKPVFNKHHFQLFVNGYEMKGNNTFTYDRKTPGEKDSKWVYSHQTVSFIVDRLVDSPKTELDSLKRSLEKSK